MATLRELLQKAVETSHIVSNIEAQQAQSNLAALGAVQSIEELKTQLVNAAMVGQPTEPIAQQIRTLSEHNQTITTATSASQAATNYARQNTSVAEKWQRVISSPKLPDIHLSDTQLKEIAQAILGLQQNPDTPTSIEDVVQQNGGLTHSIPSALDTKIRRSKDSSPKHTISVMELLTKAQIDYESEIELAKKIKPGKNPRKVIASFVLHCSRTDTKSKPTLEDVKNTIQQLYIGDAESRKAIENRLIQLGFTGALSYFAARFTD